MQEETTFMVKRFLTAKSAKELELMQLKNNVATGKYHKYDIMFDGKSWYAWFLTDARSLIKPKIGGKDAS